MILLDDLEIYKLANEVGEDVWYIVNEWNYFERDTLDKQFTRAADSIKLLLSWRYLQKN